MLHRRRLLLRTLSGYGALPLRRGTLDPQRLQKIVDPTVVLRVGKDRCSMRVYPGVILQDPLCVDSNRIDEVDLVDDQNVGLGEDIRVFADRRLPLCD